MSDAVQEIALATHNAGKIAEFQRLAAELPIAWRPASDFGLEAPEETEDSYLGNATLKARWVCDRTGTPALADDTGIEIDALGGAPGVYTADFARSHGGWASTYDHLAQRLGLEDDGASSPATAVCALALAVPDGPVLTAEARIRGALSWPPHPSWPGFAAMFRASSPATPFYEDAVLLHRRRAFLELWATYQVALSAPRRS